MDTVMDGEQKTIGELEADLENKVPGKMDVGKLTYHHDWRRFHSKEKGLMRHS